MTRNTPNDKQKATVNLRRYPDDVDHPFESYGQMSHVWAGAADHDHRATAAEQSPVEPKQRSRKHKTGPRIRVGEAVKRLGCGRTWEPSARHPHER